MAQKPNNLPLIVVAVCAAGALLGLNIMQQNNDPVIREKVSKEQEREQAKKNAANAKNNPPPTQSGETSPGANEVASWGGMKSFGKPGGKPKIVVAWQWTPAIQGNSSSIYTAVETIKKVMPTAEIDAVNLDAKPGGATKPGVSVDGTLRVPLGPNGTLPPEQGLIPALMSGGPGRSGGVPSTSDSPKASDAPKK